MNGFRKGFDDNGEIYRAPFPHCDSRILHAPGECGFCDHFSLQQHERIRDGIAFTGHAPRGGQEPCPADVARPPMSASDHRRWPGNRSWSQPHSRQLSELKAYTASLRSCIADAGIRGGHARVMRNWLDRIDELATEMERTNNQGRRGDA